MEAKQIKPEDILSEKAKTILAEVILAVNELIAKNWNGISSTIHRDELLARYFQLVNLPNDHENQDNLIDNHGLEFKEIYEKEGWIVRYESPDYKAGYLNDFEPYFLFTRK